VGRRDRASRRGAGFPARLPHLDSLEQAFPALLALADSARTSVGPYGDVYDLRLRLSHDGASARPRRVRVSLATAATHSGDSDARVALTGTAISSFLPGLMDSTLSEWLNLLVRWVHVFAGILWVGSTYYFTWLDRQLTLAASANERGVWMVHSGGFYLVEKQKSPAIDPAKLHWFRFEALATLVSGLLLLGIVYYGGGMMVDEGGLSNGAAVALGVAVIAGGWFVYDLFWRSPLGRNFVSGAAVCYVALVALVYGLTRVLSGRAAYIHVGAMMGSIMALNVWVRILPAQRKLVAAVVRGEAPDQALADGAKTRSKHNTFLVIPVVLIMISNHFPTATYGADRSWLVLAVLILVGWAAAKILRDR
jgi:uncharacterized membrane protein